MFVGTEISEQILIFISIHEFKGICEPYNIAVERIDTDLRGVIMSGHVREEQ